MEWAFFLLWVYAGAIMFWASKREWESAANGERLVLFALAVVFWPLYPILAILDD